MITPQPGYIVDPNNPNGVIRADAVPTPAPTTTLAQDQAKAANQGKAGYDVLGNPIASVTSAPTAGSIYSGISGNSELDSAYKTQIDSAKTASEQPVDEATIRANTLAAFQAEIDAQNRLFADKLAQAKITGADRLGSGTAIQARRGLIGSDFGAAQTDKINTLNNDVYASIENERAAAISAILTKARESANAEIEKKTAAKKAGLDEYVKYLGEAATRKTDKAKQAATLLVQGGHKIEDLSADELTKLTNDFGITVQDLKNAFDPIATAYADEKTKKAREALAADDAHKKIESDITKTKSEIELAKKKFDEDVRQFGLEYALKKQASDAKSITTTGGVYTPGADKVVDSWAERIQNGTAKMSDIPASQAALRNKVSVALQAMGNSTEGKPVTTELGKQALTTAKALLTKFEAGKGTSAVGKSRNFGGAVLGYLSGTDAQDFSNDFNTLKSQLSLDAVKYLKGQGAVSDAERALLASAVTKLNLAQSESEFKATLNDLISKLEGNVQTDIPQTNTETSGTVRMTGPDGVFDVPTDQVQTFKNNGYQTF